MPLDPPPQLERTRHIKPRQQTTQHRNLNIGRHMISTADLSTPRVSISRRGFDEIGGPWVALPHMHSMNLLILKTVQFGAVKQAFEALMLYLPEEMNRRGQGACFELRAGLMFGIRFGACYESPETNSGICLV